MIVFGAMRMGSMFSTFLLHNEGSLDFQTGELRCDFVRSRQA